jgi:nucleoid-associated protein YgaU
MDRLEQLKQKYAPALAEIQRQGVRLANLHVENNKLFVKGAAPSETAKNRVWDQIKAVNPAADDITADLVVDPTLAPPPAAAPQGQKYTVQPGDTLSKLAKQYYGNANQYMKIFEANRDQLTDPDKIKVGQVLNIPA